MNPAGDLYASTLSDISIESTRIAIEPKNGQDAFVVRLAHVQGIILYRDERLGILTMNDDVLDLPVSAKIKLQVSFAIAKAAQLYQAA